jgi:uncharacterized protein YqhQ
MRSVSKTAGSILRRVTQLAALPLLQAPEEALIGGQAVIEGVMMRSKHSFAVAVRRPSGIIAIIQDLLLRPAEKRRWLRYPVLRGLGVLGQAMVLGIRALRYSAEQALEQPEPALSPQNLPNPELGTTAIESPVGKTSGKKPQLSNWLLTLNLIFSVGFFIVFYKVLPLYVATVLRHHYGVFNNVILFNLADGVVRIGLFLGFLMLLVQWKEIKRLFEYHGAEHKVVWAFERTGCVDLATARGSTRFHPRCGTSFLLVVMAIAMVCYLFLPFQSFGGRLLSRIVLLPVIAGVSYEFIRFAARSKGTLWRWASQPGLWLQRVTTREPDDSQLETSIAALEAAMELERARGGELVVA